MARLISLFLLWAMRSATYRQRVGNSELGTISFYRYCFLRDDEYPDLFEDRRKAMLDRVLIGQIKSEAWTGRGEPRFRKLPWWQPCNMFVHMWRQVSEDEYHDHPRWSITIVLRGRIIERQPWSERVLCPGSIVFRTCKTIHAFTVPEGYGCRTWTLFIVGRRKRRQNTYKITKG